MPRLLVQPTGQSPAEVFPESESKFFLRIVDVQVTFQKGPGGKVTGLVMNQGGSELSGKRIE